MNLKNARIERCGPFFSKDNCIAVNLFKEKFPLECSEEIELEMYVKVYSQDVFVRGECVNTIPFYVIAIVPKESFTDWSINLKKIRINSSFKSLPGRYEFQVSINLVPGSFFVKLYTIPSNDIDLSPPKSFKSKISCKNTDFI